MLRRLSELIEAIRIGLFKQNQFEFSAPWNPRSGR